MNRETWLNEMASRMAPRFAELGHPLPPYRVALGFPGSGSRTKVAGECWNKAISADAHYEIFINPVRDDSLAIAATLAHELAHAAAGLQCGHSGDFAKIVKALGFGRPYTSTEAGTTDTVRAWLQGMVDELGALPHGKLIIVDEGVRVVKRVRGGVDAAPRVPAGENSDGGDANGEATEPINNRPPKQSTRLLKASCTAGDCGYTVRVTAKWLTVGPPHCPIHGAMETDDA